MLWSALATYLAGLVTGVGLTLVAQQLFKRYRSMEEAVADYRPRPTVVASPQGEPFSATATSDCGAQEDGVALATEEVTQPSGDDVAPPAAASETKTGLLDAQDATQDLHLLDNLPRLLEGLNRVSTTSGDEQSAAAASFNWVDWLYGKRVALDRLPRPERIRQVERLWPRFDEYVWSDVQTSSELSFEQLRPFWRNRDHWSQFIACLVSLQCQSGAWLSELGFERLTFAEGAPFRTGVLEALEDGGKQTDRREWDGMAAEVASGHGGYKLGGLVRRAAVASRLRCGGSISSDGIVDEGQELHP